MRISSIILNIRLLNTYLRKIGFDSGLFSGRGKKNFFPSWTVILLLISMFSIFCTPEKLEPGIPVNFDTIQSEEYDPVMEKGLDVGKNISIEGYLGLTDMMTLQTSTILVTLYEQKDRSGKELSVSIPVGTKENQIESLPDSYTMDDLKVRTHLKEVAGTKDKVRIHGIRLGSKKEGSIYVQSKWIERVTE